VVPRAQNFLQALGPYTAIADPIVMSQDFSQLQSLSHEEQQKSLRELTQRGETIQAIYTARRLYGCGLSEAKEMVEGLRGQRAEERTSPPRRSN
jgi:ribosomal protein L7/L12